MSSNEPRLSSRPMLLRSSVMMGMFRHISCVTKYYTQHVDGSSITAIPIMVSGMRSSASRLLRVLVAIVASLSAPLTAQSPGELRWGGDPEGGAPYVEADPNDPNRVVGFEVDVAGLLAKGLGLQPRFVFTP